MNKDNQLARSTPEAQGISSLAVRGFVEAAEKSLDALHSFVLLRHGCVVAEGWWAPYAPQHPHMLFSLSKSFTSTAVGMAVAEGRLSVKDSVLSFFPDEAPAEVSPNLAAMRVKHLLAMCTGHTEDTTVYLWQSPDGNWVKAFLARPVEREPGTHFLYNTGATYMLSAIVQKLTGQKLIDYLQPRLWGPLGIENPAWEECPRGINTGGFGLSVRTEDIARFGQLYLQKGAWNGQRLLAEAWVNDATSSHISNGTDPKSDWAQGYGYQFWRCRNNVYRGDGAFGQYCIVMPEQDAVLAITSGIGDMQVVLNLVWDCLQPEMESTPLPQNGPAQQVLTRKLASLALPTQQGELTSPIAKKVSGKTYAFEPNDMKLESITLDFSGGRGQYTIRGGQIEQSLVCGYGEWVKGTARFDRDESRPVAASGAWTTDDTYVVKQCFYETPFCPTLTLHFNEDRLTVDMKANVGFGPTERPQLVARAV